MNKFRSLIRILAAGAGLALASRADAVVFQINFGSAYNEAGWSSFSTNTVGAKIDLVDSLGNVTPVDLILNTQYNSQDNQGAQTNTVGLPNDVAVTRIYAGGADNPTFTLSNLDTSLTYTFSVFASRRGATGNHSAIYTATGANIVSGELDAANNTGSLLSLSGLLADAEGNIVFDFEKAAGNTSNWVHLNSIIITGTPIPEPSSFALLGGFGCLVIAIMRRRRV